MPLGDLKEEPLGPTNASRHWCLCSELARKLVPQVPWFPVTKMVTEGDSLKLKTVHPVGVEPTTIRLEGGCSIQLSYGC